MSRRFTISLDAMGGDHGPRVVVPAALNVLARNPGSVELVLVGDESVLREELRRHGHKESDHLHVRHASQQVGMNEPPSQALRLKKDSSMRVAIDLVKDGVADACVSSGNTGALMATARYVLKTLPGIDRPAICASIPSLDGSVRMLDLGANVDCSAEHLFQFAVMGSVLTEAVDNLPNPRVGLLNNGEEEIKGNDQVKRAAQLLQQSDLNYQGYVEGDRVYHGVVDVLVCDGFVGNVATKTSEGVAWLISHYMQAEFRRNALTKIAGLAALPVLNALRRRLDTRAYNGASLLGLRGIVLKSHGSADVYAFEKALEVGIAEAETAVPTLIDQRLGEAFARGRQEP